MTTAAIGHFFQRSSVALRHRDFRWILLGSLCGQSAYWALIVIRGVMVLEMSGSSGLVGIVTFAAMAPRFIMPPLAGYMADRFDRRTVLAASYSLQLGHSVVLAALAFADVLTVWQLITLSLIDGSFRTFQITATQTLIPNLVPRNRWLNAIALNQLAIQSSRLVGPGLIVPVLLIANPESAILVTIGFYGIGIFGVLSARIRSTGALKRGAKMGASMLSAIRYVWSDPQLRPLFILVMLHCSMTMSFESMLPVLARDTLGESSASVSYLMMGVGSGALVSIIGIAGMRSATGRGRLLLVTGFLSGISMLVLALSDSVAVALLGAVAMGGSQAAFMAISATLVQTLAPDGMRGRITGLEQINVGGAMALVNLVNGFVADIYSAPEVLLALGLGFAAAVAVSLAVGSLRGIYRGAIDSHSAPVDRSTILEISR